MGAIKRAFANNITTSGNLAALDAANLTGTLPAISGANLTGISADFVKISNTTISSDVANVTFEPSNFTDYKIYCVFINRVQVSNDNMNFRMTIKESSVVISHPNMQVEQEMEHLLQLLIFYCHGII